MSLWSAKGKKTKKRPTSARSKASSKRTRKLRLPRFSSDCVCWTLEISGGCSLRLGRRHPGGHKERISEIFTPAERKISRSNWRETVSPGDIVELAFATIGYRARSGVQRAKSKSKPTVLVLEPVFVGYCVSAPLIACARKPTEIHPDLIVLQQSGFAFNDGNKDRPDNWLNTLPMDVNFRYLGDCALPRSHVVATPMS